MDEEKRDLEIPVEAGQQEQEQGQETGAPPAKVEEAEALRTQCGELSDKYLRLYAEFENFRKRTAKERQDLIKYGPEPLVYELLSVLDTLEMGLQHAGEGASNGLKRGIEMTLKEFIRILEKFGLKRVASVGEPFDPRFHEAMSQVERDDVAEGTVVDEFRKGYTFHDKLLRASMVSVSKRSCAPEDEIKINTVKEES